MMNEMCEKIDNILVCLLGLHLSIFHVSLKGKGSGSECLNNIHTLF